MKKVLALVLMLLTALCLCTAALADVEINEANFPNDYFRYYVSSKAVDADQNGTLSDDELQKTRMPELEWFDNIESLKGIEYFTSLTSLNLMGFRITELDVSKLAKLTSLTCNFTTLSGAGLTSLILSDALVSLDCSGNKLTSLDVSRCAKLKKLYCFDNQLTSLDVSRNTALTDLYCDGNADGFHLIVAPDSYAMSYAIEKGIPYEIADPTVPAIDPAYAGIYDLDGVKVLVKNGQIDTTAVGLTRDAAHPDDWYFCSEGVIRTDVTQIVPYETEWFYVKEGKLDTTMAAIVDYDGGKFAVAAGRLLREYNGLIQNPNGTEWYFVAAGQVQTQYTGLAMYDNAWFYVESGRLAEEFTGDVEYDGAMFHVDHGMLVG